METVTALHDVLVHGEVFLLNPLQLWRVIRHEGMGEVVDSIVIDRSKIPRLCFHQRRRDRVH